MQWDKAFSIIVAVALSGSGVFVMSPAEAKPRNGDTDAVYGKRVAANAPRRVVSYRDLNLATPSGERMLNKRVRIAVRGVCAESVPIGDAYEEFLCQGLVWGGARPQIANAVMRAREIASTGTSAMLPVAITLSAFPR